MRIWLCLGACVDLGLICRSGGGGGTCEVSGVPRGFLEVPKGLWLTEWEPVLMHMSDPKPPRAAPGGSSGVHMGGDSESVPQPSRHASPSLIENMLKTLCILVFNGQQSLSSEPLLLPCRPSPFILISVSPPL